MAERKKGTENMKKKKKLMICCLICADIQLIKKAEKKQIEIIFFSLSLFSSLQLLQRTLLKFVVMFFVTFFFSCCFNLYA